VDANKRYCKQYRLTRYTNGRRRVDAAPYAALVRRYTTAGWSYSELAALAGCSESVIHILLNGTPRISPLSAARLDAIPATPPRPGEGAYVDVTGAQRRIRALHRIGHPMQDMAAALDLHPDHVSRIAHGRMPNVTSATDRNIKALYAAWQTRPGRSGESQQRAIRHGWRDPQWWEDYGRIDDPAFNPDDIADELGFRERAALRREEIIHLAWCGHEPEQILDRLNNEVSISTVRQIVQEWRTGQKRDRKAVAA
jgi:plasmid maintenance system antidote protein VapI